MKPNFSSGQLVCLLQHAAHLDAEWDHVRVVYAVWCVFVQNLTGVSRPALGKYCPAVNMMTQARGFMRR